MATAKRTRKAAAKRSVRITATKTRDARFLALLRNKCLQAASIGALTAAGEAIPGLSSVLGLVFGELVDVRFLASIQRELIEETFEIYGFDLPKPVRAALVDKVQLLGAGASVASDAVVRQMIRHSLGGLGGLLTRRVLPIASIASSAFSNAWVTYALGKRAQAVAQLQSAPLDDLPEALRAFSGVDERRVFAWTVEATKSTLGRIGGALRNLSWLKSAGGSKHSRAGKARKAADR
jgi:uncharacterized protein (DUF697 family)